MLSSFLRLGALGLAAFLSNSLAATIPGGSILVSQSGDGSGTPSNNGAAASVIVFGTSGDPQSTIQISTGKLQVQGTRGGRLALAPDGLSVGLAGYLPPFSGSGDLSSRDDAEAPRGFINIYAKSGLVSAFTKIGDLDAKAADSIVVDGSRAWLAGEDDLVYWDGGTDTVFDSGTFLSKMLPKGIRTFENRLFLTGLRPNFPGFVADFDGFPHGDADQPRILFDVTNPSDIAVTDSGNTIYVARSDGSVDVYKKDPGWTFKYRFSAGSAQLRGVAVDTSGDKPVVYAIDTDHLWKATDDGNGASFDQIASSTNKRAFLGIVVTPGGGAPELKVTSGKRVTTTRSVFTIRGTAADANGLRAIRIRRGLNGPFVRARGKESWLYRASLRVGTNSFYVQAVDNLSNRSKRIRVKITRQ